MEAASPAIPTAEGVIQRYLGLGKKAMAVRQLGFRPIGFIIDGHSSLGKTSHRNNNIYEKLVSIFSTHSQL